MIETSSRLLALLSLLESRPVWAGSDLAARLDVTPRTVRRDVGRLRRLGYLVHAAPGVAGGYRLGAGEMLPPLTLDDGEAVAVALGLRSVAVAGVSDETSLRALAKLEQILPERLRRRVRAIGAHTLPVVARTPVVDADVLAALALACRDHERLRLSYADRTGAASGRTVEPLAVVQRDRLWYLVAWDPGRAGWRSFRVDRMGGAPSPAGRFQPRTPPAGGAAAVIVSRDGGRPVWEARVVVHCGRPELTARLPAGYGEIEVVDDDTSLISVATGWLDGLAVTLAGLDLEIDVIEPPELRDELRVWARRFARVAPAPR